MPNQRMINSLKRILQKGIISPKLRTVIKQLISALAKDDLGKAYSLSAVKSKIAYRMIIPKKNPPKKYPFREDSVANERILRRSVYGIMDDIHFQISMKLHKTPSGTVILTAIKKER